ncbi:MAG: DUF167 domain-containing protein [Oligoflexia bacterium]|nr:DUF167 domain-containing protein [Oligoflexia bacterium]
MIMKENGEKNLKELNKLNEMLNKFKMAFAKNAITIKIDNDNFIKSAGSELNVSLHVQAKPSSKEQKIIVLPEGELKIYVRAQPIEGRANQEIIDLLSEKLGVAKSLVAVVKGNKNKFKQLIVKFVFSKQKMAQYYLQRIENLLK